MDILVREPEKAGDARSGTGLKGWWVVVDDDKNIFKAFAGKPNWLWDLVN